MPRSRLRLNRAAASAEPVEPPDTSACARPSATARAAWTIEASGGARRLEVRACDCFCLGTAIAVSVSGRRQAPRLLEPHLRQLRPAWIGRPLVPVLRPGGVEGRAADRAQPRALLAAQELLRDRQRERVTGPSSEVENAAVDVRRGELLPFSIRLRHLAR